MKISQEAKERAKNSMDLKDVGDVKDVMNKKEFIELIESKIETVDEFGAQGIRQDSLLDLSEWIDQFEQHIKEKEKNRIIRIIKGRLLIKKIRDPIIKLIQHKE